MPLLSEQTSPDLILLLPKSSSYYPSSVDHPEVVVGVLLCTMPFYPVCLLLKKGEDLFIICRSFMNVILFHYVAKFDLNQTYLCNRQTSYKNT